MTCIVGVLGKNGTVLIGGDSSGILGWDLTIRKDPKVFVNDGYAFGFVESFRMGQLLAWSFKPPIPEPKADLLRFMSTTFVDAIRNCFKDGGYATKDSDAEKGGEFLVARAGRLFRVDHDYQVGESIYGFHAAGCGSQYARGALHATPKMEPRKRVLNALEIAERCSAGVRGPFNVVST